MERGDLELWTRPRYVVVVEGVLCRVEPVVREHRWPRRPRVSGYNTQWYDVPLKRLLYMKDRWPNTAQDLVTFTSQEFCDQAAEFLTDAGIQYDDIYYRDLASFAQTLRFKPDIQSVYDSDPSRLDRFGQVGHAVVAGEDLI